MIRSGQGAPYPTVTGNNPSRTPKTYCIRKPITKTGSEIATSVMISAKLSTSPRAASRLMMPARSR